MARFEPRWMTYRTLRAQLWSLGVWNIISVDSFDCCTVLVVELPEEVICGSLLQYIWSHTQTIFMYVGWFTMRSIAPVFYECPEHTSPELTYTRCYWLSKQGSEVLQMLQVLT
jgi:hypothetical protein